MDYPDFPPKHPLSDAIHLVYEATMMAVRHYNEREGKLTQQDVHLFERLRETVWIQYFNVAQVFNEARSDFAKQLVVPPERPAAPRN